MREEVKISIWNSGFWLGFGFMFACFLSHSLPQWLEFLHLPWNEHPDAFIQSIQAIFFGGVILLIPFCASASCAVSQVDEIRTSFLQLKLLRSSLRRYAVRKVTVNALSGALVVSLAFSLHAALWNIIATPIDPVKYPWQELHLYGLYGNWYSTLHGLPVYISIALGMAVCGSAFSTAALASAIWVPDKLLTVAIPAGIYFLWAKVINTVLGVNLPHPSDLYNDALTWEVVWQSLAIYVVFISLCVLLYVIGLKRRMKYV